MPLPFWTQKLHFGPVARMGHAAAYDAARQRVVLFGGTDGTSPFGDTWVWDGALWTQVAETGPEPRTGHAIAYDGVRQQVVLFGGRDGDTTNADTWVWDGAAWTQVAETGPSARHGHAMAFDEQRRLTVLFGGTDAVDVGDTWQWDGTAWTQQEESGPSARRGHAMAYDRRGSSVLLFGGASGAEVFDDTWEWNGTQWRQLAEFGPPGLMNAAMAYAGLGTALFGGVGSTDAAEPGHDSTWEWSGQFWTELLHFGPPGRSSHAYTFDSQRRRLVVHGGVSTLTAAGEPVLLGDTWECPAREAILVSVTVTPPTIEAGDPITIVVALNEAVGEPFTVQVAAAAPDNTASLGLPSTITVPAGQATATMTASVPFEAPGGKHRITARAGDVSRSAELQVVPLAAPGTVRITAVLPNPAGDEMQDEEVHLKNFGPTAVDLAGWRLTSLTNPSSWNLNVGDGTVAPKQVAVIKRRGRPMPLNNAGDAVRLFNLSGAVLDTKLWGAAASGQVLQLE